MALAALHSNYWSGAGAPPPPPVTRYKQWGMGFFQACFLLLFLNMVIGRING